MIEAPRDAITYAGIKVCYKSLPENTEIKIFVKENWGKYRELEGVNDKKRHTIESRVNLEMGTAFQVKIRLESHENLAPEITQIIINSK